MDIEGVAYCVLYVADLDRMTEFYAGTLALPVVERSPRFVAFGGAGAPLALEVGGPAVTGARAKDQNPVLFQLRVADIGRAVAELAARGVAIEGAIRHGPFGALAFFRDPEGNRLALLQPVD